jgi:hypothetical protein
MARFPVLEFLLGKPGEPDYEGKKLSAWLRDVDYGQPQAKREKAGTNTLQNARFSPQIGHAGRTVRAQNTNEQSSNQYAAFVRVRRSEACRS